MLRRGFLLLLPSPRARRGPGARSDISVSAEQAATLRARGLAQLENERPGEAGETFLQLTKLKPDDPLPWANLAVAALRQQKSEEAAGAIAKALAKAPGRADLLAIQGDILQWSGKDEEALAAYRKAAAAAPDRVTIQYALYHQAAQSSGPDAEAARAEALRPWRALRPENLVVLVQQGQRAIAAGDRAGATQAFLRVRELLGPTPSPAAASALAPVLAALEVGRHGRRAGAGHPAGKRAQTHARLPAEPARAGAGHPRRPGRTLRGGAAPRELRRSGGGALPRDRPGQGARGRPGARHRRLRRRRQARPRLGDARGRPRASWSSAAPAAIPFAGPRRRGSPACSPPISTTTGSST